MISYEWFVIQPLNEVSIKNLLNLRVVYYKFYVLNQENSGFNEKTFCQTSMISRAYSFADLAKLFHYLNTK